MPDQIINARGPGWTVPTRIKIPTLLLLLLAASTSGFASTAELVTDSQEVSAGYYRLSWRSAEPVRLVESRSVDFQDARVIYSGDDTATVFSGKPDGTWHYRLEASDSRTPVSNSVSIVVRHHSLQRAWAFFGLGAFVFLATLGLVLLGHRQSGMPGERID